MAGFTTNGRTSWLPRIGYLLVVAGIFVAGLITGGRRSFLEFVPASFPECRGPDIVAHVRWDASASTRRSVKMYVHQVGNQPKLWFEGPPVGETDTGKWIADGSTLELTDHKGRLLAMRTMQSTLCD